MPVEKKPNKAKPFCLRYDRDVVQDPVYLPWRIRKTLENHDALLAKAQARYADLEKEEEKAHAHYLKAMEEVRGKEEEQKHLVKVYEEQIQKLTSLLGENQEWTAHVSQDIDILEEHVKNQKESKMDIDGVALSNERGGDADSEAPIDGGDKGKDTQQSGL